MNEGMNSIFRDLYEWAGREERAGRKVDIYRLNERMQIMMNPNHNSHKSDFNGLSTSQLHEMLYNPFGQECIVKLNWLFEEEYTQIPLVRQAMFLMKTLSETEIKLTKNGWLPLKIVAAAYPLGCPSEVVEYFHPKRINEYDVMSLWMVRIILELSGWLKTRKGMLSLTAKGKKALSNPDELANYVIRHSLICPVLHEFDGNEDQRIGNDGIAYSVWILHKFGNEWHSGNFYQEQYQKILNFSDKYNIYATRVYERLFYWLGIIEKKESDEKIGLFKHEFRATSLLTKLFSFGGEKNKC